MKFSEQVIEARRQLNLTQMKLAEELSVSFSSVNRWERGHTEPPQVVKNVFYNYCSARGVKFEPLNRKCILKHKDVDVIEIELNESGMIAAFGAIYSERHLPVGTMKKSGIDFAELKNWWSGRSIPASRDGLKDFLRNLGMLLPQQLLDKSSGLSLSDQYWICPKGEGIEWAKINFFYNDFSEDVGNLLFGGVEGRDAEAISLFSPDNTSDGVLKKKWKIIDGKRCLIKGGTLPINQEVANEVLAARICKRLGIPYVDYWILDIDGVKYSVCEDFITADTELVPAWRIKSLFKKDNNISEYEAFITKAEEMGLKDVRRRVDMMLTLDFIIANTDRHYNNFGLVRDANTLEWLSVAPIYDSGTSMWCKELPGAMNAESPAIESKPFRSKHAKQIELVKDFSWLNLDALDGIEDEFLKILESSVADSMGLELRNRKLCLTLRKRIEALRRFVVLQE
jgi:hypothetical protein